MGCLSPAVSAPKVKIDGDIVGSESLLHWSPNLSHLARSRGSTSRKLCCPSGGNTPSIKIKEWKCCQLFFCRNTAVRQPQGASRHGSKPMSPLSRLPGRPASHALRDKHVAGHTPISVVDREPSKYRCLDSCQSFLRHLHAGKILEDFVF